MKNVAMLPQDKELIFLILQFLNDCNFNLTAHKLEQESGVLFNMEYFENQILAGQWDEVESYLGGFTEAVDNMHSMVLFSRIRSLKYVEGLDGQDPAKAYCDFQKDLSMFKSSVNVSNQIFELYDDSKFRDRKSRRRAILPELKKLVKKNPLICDKLEIPPFEAARLRTLIDQSLKWQHNLCKSPCPNSDIKTLLIDHCCASNSAKHDEASCSRSTRPSCSPYDLPKTVVLKLSQGSNVMSMDFHPLRQTVLIVGTDDGHISMWEVGSLERLVLETFKVWNKSAFSKQFQIILANDATISVNRCLWGPDGSILD